MGAVVPFPRPPARRFAPEVLAHLVRFAAAIPGAQPLWFGVDGHGAEFCRLANGCEVGFDRRGRLVLTDTTSGFVDEGPFGGLDEVCELLASVAA